MKTQQEMANGSGLVGQAWKLGVSQLTSGRCGSFQAQSGCLGAGDSTEHPVSLPDSSSGRVGKIRGELNTSDDSCPGACL